MLFILFITCKENKGADFVGKVCLEYLLHFTRVTE